MSSARPRPGSTAAPAGSFHRAPVRQVLDITQSLCPKDTVFSSEKFALAMLEGGKEIEASCPQALLQEGKACSSQERRGQRGREGLRPRGTQFKTWERNSLGGTQGSVLGAVQELESGFVLPGCSGQWKQLRLIGHLGSDPLLYCL